MEFRKDTGAGLAGPALALAAFAAVWMLYGTFAIDSIHHDMGEAWGWGREPALGYPKHPPLMAWMTGLWFRVLPTTDWAFYLLSGINAAVGLAGVFAIAGRFGNRDLQWMAMLATMATPFYGFMALKFNANAVLLSVWPWTIYAFLRAMDGGRLWAIAFGMLAGLSLLGKYYSALLIVACLGAALLSAEGRRLFATPQPYLAALAGLVVVAPHLVWAAGHGFQTVGYAMSKVDPGTPDVAGRGLVALTSALATWGLLALALAWFVRRSRRSLVPRLLVGVRRPRNWPLLALAVGPAALTFVACFAAQVRISTQFLLPAFPLVGLALLVTAGLRPRSDDVRRAGRAIALCGVGVLMLAPLTQVIAARAHSETARLPAREIAAEVTALWRADVGGPLRILAGDPHLVLSAAFYALDRPTAFPSVDPAHSPWVTPARIATEGMVIVCGVQTGPCSQSWHPDQRVVTWTPGKHSRRTAASYRILIVPPALWRRSPQG